MSIPTSSPESLLLFSTAVCHVDYEEEKLHLKFQSVDFSWILKKITIYYQGGLVKTHSIPEGLPSSDVFDSIEFEMSIADMNIQFFGDSAKNFKFDLVYTNLSNNEDYKAR